MLTIGIYEPDEGIRRRIEELTEAITPAAWVEIADLKTLREATGLGACDLILVDVAQAEDCELIRQAVASAPLARWVALLSAADPTLENQATRSGFGFVLLHPVDSVALRQLLSPTLNRATVDLTPLGAPLARGATVGVWSWLGGVGRTTLAANLAAGLAECLPLPVCLAEVATGPSQLQRLAAQQSPYHLQDLAELTPPLTMSDLRNLVAPTSYQVGLLTTSPNLSPPAADWMTKVGTRLRECPIASVLDIPSGWSELVRSTLAECTVLVLVSSPEPEALDLTADAWTSIRQTIPTTPSVHLVLNAIQDDRRWSEDALKQRFHADSVTQFPHDYKTISESWKRGRPLLRQDKGSRWRQARDQLVKLLVDAMALT